MMGSVLDELTIMDDICMKWFFDDRPDLAAIVLRAVLGDPDITVDSARTERILVNFNGHSTQFDVFCTGPGVRFDLELQADIARAWRERAEYYAATLATDSLPKGSPYPDLPRLEIVFVTNGDALGLGEPLISFEMANLGKGIAFGGRIRITYVDASYNGFGLDTELGRVVHDLLCPDPDEMLIPAFAEKMRELKEKLKGDKEMETYTQRIRQEALEEGMERGEEIGMEKGEKKNRIDIVTRLVREKDMSFDAIADLLGFTVDEVRSYAKGASLGAC